jgi:hypothetical protein
VRVRRLLACTSGGRGGRNRGRRGGRGGSSATSGGSGGSGGMHSGGGTDADNGITISTASLTDTKLNSLRLILIWACDNNIIRQESTAVKQVSFF